MSIEISREALQLVDMLREKRMAAALTIIVGEGLPTSAVTTVLRSSDEYRNAISIINTIFDEEAERNEANTSIEVRREGVLQLLNMLQTKLIPVNLEVTIACGQYNPTVTVVPQNDNDRRDAVEIINSVFNGEALKHTTHRISPQYESWRRNNAGFSAGIANVYEQDGMDS